MIRGEWRPWGQLDWLLSHTTVTQWDLIGCVATEPRCLSSLKVLTRFRGPTNAQFFQITDEDSRFQSHSVALLTERREQLRTLIGGRCNIRPCHLFDLQADLVRQIDESSDLTGNSVLVDISCLPKRFFFPLLRRLLTSGSKRNIVITYSLPSRYGEDPLAIDPEPWKHLPTFMPPFPEPKNKTLVVSAGFEPYGLPKLLSSGEFGTLSTKILFPSPSPPPEFQRNWDFVRRLVPSGADTASIEYVNKHSVPDVFEALRRLSNNGEEYLILAPFGPKPMSLAMCLYAISDYGQQGGSAVYYTQPKAYNPSYTIGTQQTPAGPAVLAYFVRIAGKNVYSRRPDD